MFQFFIVFICCCVISLRVSVIVADVADADVNGFVQTCRTKNVASVEQMFRMNPSLLILPGGSSVGGQTCLMSATLVGAIDIVRWCLEKGADVTVGEKDGYTPMHGAGFQGRADIAKILIEHGLDPSDVHHDGFTPLHRACWGMDERHTDFVRVLLEHGVKPNEEAADKSRPCDYSRNKNTSKVIKRAIRKGPPKPVVQVPKVEVVEADATGSEL
jgi:ankyrin repeat protein